MGIRFGTIELLLCVVLVVIFSPLSTVDTRACPGENDGYGPCSDTGATVTTGGSNFCGGCSDLVTVIVGGNCGGGAGSGAFDCNDCREAPQTIITPQSSQYLGVIQSVLCASIIYYCQLSGGGNCETHCAQQCNGRPNIEDCTSSCVDLCEEDYPSGGGGDGCNCFVYDCENDCVQSGAPILSGEASRCG